MGRMMKTNIFSAGLSFTGMAILLLSVLTVFWSSATQPKIWTEFRDGNAICWNGTHYQFGPLFYRICPLSPQKIPEGSAFMCHQQQTECEFHRHVRRWNTPHNTWVWTGRASFGSGLFLALLLLLNGILELRHKSAWSRFKKIFGLALVGITLITGTLFSYLHSRQSDLIEINWWGFGLFLFGILLAGLAILKASRRPLAQQQP
jgi:hypothetical protein